MKVFVFFILLLTYSKVYSQEYAARLYTPQKDGLIQAQVFCITQSDDGYLWVGTLGGLSRFDGLKFTNYTEEDGLLSNAVFNMQWWNDTLFVVTKEGVNIMVDGKISTFFYDKNIKFKEAKIKINNKYRYIVAHNYKYRFMLNLKTKKIIPFTNYCNENIINSLSAALTDSSIIYGYKNKLYEISYSNLTSNTCTPLLLCSFKENVDDITILRNKILTAYAPYIPYKNGKKDFVSLIHTNDKKHPVVKERTFKISSKNIPHKVYITRAGKVFLFSDSGNIYFEENGTTTKFSGSYNIVNNFFEDNNGILWVATEKGLLKIYPNKFIYYNHNQGYPDNVWAAGRLNDSLILMATYNKGIHIYYNNGKEKKIEKVLGAPLLLSYFGLCKGFNDDFFVSTNPGVAVYNVVDNSLQIIDDKIKETSLTLFKDNKRNEILVANLKRLAVINDNYTTDTLFNVNTVGSNNMIISLAVLNNDIFLGLTKGLIDFDLKTKKAKISYEKLRFNSLAVDSNNTIWAGTDRGIMHITNNTAYFIKGITCPKEVSSIIMDDNNRLFASGRLNLYVIDLKKFYNNDKDYLTSYGFYDGYIGDGPQQDAFYKDYKGNLWLPTEYNVINIIPSEFGNGKRHLKTILTALTLSNGDTSRIITDVKQRRKIDYSFNDLKFQYLSINLKNPELTKYQYILKNKQREWKNITKEREVFFNNLPSGKYTFSVKAFVGNDFSKAKETSMEFTILPPFWQTTWFIILAFVLFTTVVVIITLQIKKKEQKKNKIKLELSKLKNIALSTQIDHHFLANCTSKIVILYESGKIEEANSYIRTFSDFLRRNLMYLRADKISLKEELILVEQYVELEHRYGKDFDFKVEADSKIDIEKIMIFPFMIQPIVENAIKHGVKRKTSGKGRILLNLKKNKDFLCLKVEDNGPGIDSNKTNRRKGVSLKIIEERLVLTGKKSKIKINSDQNGTVVIIRIQNN